MQYPTRSKWWSKVWWCGILENGPYS